MIVETLLQDTSPAPPARHPRRYDSAVPRPQSKLSATERTALDRWVAQLDDADQHRKDVRAGFAAWVRGVGPAAVAHELGISRGAINERLKSYEGTYRRRGKREQPQRSR
jgi:hypothetical protein